MGGRAVLDSVLPLLADRTLTVGVQQVGVVACSDRRREGSRAGGPGQPRGKARARLAGRDRSIGGVQSAQTAAVQHSQWLNKRRLRGTLKPVTKHD